MARKFFDILKARWAAGARVCVGLDTDVRKIPASFFPGLRPFDRQLEYNRQIIDATIDLALAFKPNAAFYAYPGGEDVLAETFAYIYTSHKVVPVIRDGKRGDIGNTNLGYVNESFGVVPFDATTISPYLGMEANEPFLDQKDKGIIVLCKTSNPGSDEFQDVMVDVPETRFNEIVQTLPADHDGMMILRHMPMYQYVAWRARVWNRRNRNVALVVGATYPEQLKEVRKIVGDMPILLPGLGTQGGDVEKAVLAGIDSTGGGIIPNSSSGIIFAPDPRLALQQLTDQINAALAKAHA